MTRILQQMHSSAQLSNDVPASRTVAAHWRASALFRAFSLVELLVVIAIIAILITLIVVGLQRVQVAAARTDSVNALRQMVSAYLGYSGDNRMNLMPGYVDYDNAVANKGIPELNAKLGNGKWMVENNAKLNDRENLSSYVWRLSPYLSHNWRTVMADYRDSGAMSYFSSQYDQEIYGPEDEAKNPTIASAPSFGLNSIFFGGDDRHGGPDVIDHNPWNGTEDKLAATRASEVLNTRAILFAPTGAADNTSTTDEPYLTKPGLSPTPGYAELRPPFVLYDAKGGFWHHHQWKLREGGGIERADDFEGAKGAGLPIVRRSGFMLPVGRYDGSAEVIDINNIAFDMRHWSPFQTGTEVPPVDF